MTKSGLDPKLSASKPTAFSIPTQARKEECLVGAFAVAKTWRWSRAGVGGALAVACAPGAAGPASGPGLRGEWHDVSSDSLVVIT